MAQNIFDATFDANNRIDVNSFDWSHVNNLTTNFGRITPVFCELVPAKGSLRINPEFGLELMPMVFPVQTRMFARLNFFKVTLRSMWEDYSDFISNFRDDLEEPYINCSDVTFSKMFKTGSLGDYLGMPTRKSYFVSSTNVTSTVSTGSTPKPVPLIPSSYSWDSIVNNLSFNVDLSGISGLSFAASYDVSSTVLVKFTTPLKIQRYTNANFRCSILNNVKRDYIAYGLLIGISSGNEVVRTWDFSMPVDSKNDSVQVDIPLGDMVSAFGNMGPDQEGISFFILLRSADMPNSSSNVASSACVIYSTPAEDEITYSDFPFKSQKAGTSAYPRILAYRFRAYEP